MRKFLLVLIFGCLNSITVVAQHNINSSFIQTSIGGVLKLTYEYQLNNNVALEGGLKMLIPFVRSYNQHGLFFNSFYLRNILNTWAYIWLLSVLSL